MKDNNGPWLLHVFRIVRGPQFSKVSYCCHFDDYGEAKETSFPNELPVKRLENLVAEEKELGDWLKAHNGKWNLRGFLKDKMSA